ncbi:hypothetical protein ES703_103472 [subsurface metagenome]
MDKQRNWRPKRAPDVETMGFRLWEAKKEEDYGEALLEISYDKGEEMHESRVYNSPLVIGYSLLVLSKKKGEQYWVAVKGKRPAGEGFIRTEVKGPLSLEEYEELVRRVEEGFAPLFDTASPLVTPGKTYNLYMRKRKTEGG